MAYDIVVLDDDLNVGFSFFLDDNASLIDHKFMFISNSSTLLDEC